MKDLNQSQLIRAASIAAVAFPLCFAASLAAWAQQPSAPAPAVVQATPGPLAQAPQTGPGRLHLTSMERVGPRAVQPAFFPDEPLSDRQQLALADATSSLLDRFTQRGARYRALYQTARFVQRVANAPNRALCRLTGADRARLDIRKKRVSFTWFVAW
jgi:hypothetical protein